MENPLTSALLITAIGMGLVFVVIIMLWGLMALVALIRDPEEKAEAAPEEIAPVADEAALMADSGDIVEHQRRAAAIAVAVALSMTEKASPAHAAAAPQGGLSAWQAVTRSNQIQNKQLRGRVR